MKQTETDSLTTRDTIAHVLTEWHWTLRKMTLTLTSDLEIWSRPKFFSTRVTTKQKADIWSMFQVVVQRLVYTLDVDEWAVTFGTARRGLGGLGPHPVPLRRCTKCNSPPINAICVTTKQKADICNSLQVIVRTHTHTHTHLCQCIKMTYNVSSGTLNTTIQYQCIIMCSWQSSQMWKIKDVSDRQTQRKTIISDSYIAGGVNIKLRRK